MRIVATTLGALAIVAVFFFGTLQAISYVEGASRDAIRAKHARVLMAALERYSRDHDGRFPAMVNSPIEGLKSALVDGGYLDAIPEDPVFPKKTYRYHSPEGGTRYGLLFLLDRGECMIGAGTAATGWWGQPSSCSF